MRPAPIMCHQNRAESILNWAKYHEAKWSLRTTVALPEEIETKVRPGALPKPHHSREIENM